MTVSQVRTALARMIDQVTAADHADRIAQNCKRRLLRTTLARFYHWKRRNLLAPLNVHMRR